MMTFKEPLSHCCFISGASQSVGRKLSESNLVFVGAGSAGCGIAEQAVAWIRMRA